MPRMRVVLEVGCRLGWECTNESALRRYFERTIGGCSAVVGTTDFEGVELEVVILPLNDVC